MTQVILRGRTCHLCCKEFLGSDDSPCPACWNDSTLARARMEDILDQRVDPVNHPQHYLKHPSGVECIQVTEHMNFCLGNAIKYIWRHADKGGVEDLKKAKWYIEREIARLENR